MGKSEDLERVNVNNKTIWTPDNSFLLEYHAKIETGEIIAGRELWQELNNLAADFHNDEYFYNTDDAHMYIPGLIAYGDSIDFKFYWRNGGTQFLALDALDGSIDWKVTLGA